PAGADAAGGPRRSAVGGVPAARLRGGAAAAHRGLSPPGAGAAARPSGGLPAGAVRPLRAAAGAGGVAAAAGGAAPAGFGLEGGDGTPGEAGGGDQRPHGRGARLQEREAHQGAGGPEQRPASCGGRGERLLPAAPGRGGAADAVRAAQGAAAALSEAAE